MRLSIRLAIGLVITAMVCTACGSSSKSTAGASSASSSYVIGGDYPLSGPNAIYGKLYVNMQNAAAQYINSNHLIKGRIVNKYGDSQALPAPAVTAAHQLISVDNAIAILCGFSAPSKAIGPVVTAAKIPEINGGASSPDLGKLGPYVFNDIPLADSQMSVLIPYLVHKDGLKRWGVLYSEETLGESLLATLQKVIPESGAKIVKTVSVTETTTNFSSEVAQLQSANPQAVFYASTSGGEIPAFVNDEAAAGMHVVNVNYAGADTPAVLADPNAVGSYFTNQAIDTSSTSPATLAFKAAFVKDYGNTTPSSLAWNYFNATLIVAEAIHNLQASHTQVTGVTLDREMHKGTFVVAGGVDKFASNGVLANASVNIDKLVAVNDEKLVATAKG